MTQVAAPKLRRMLRHLRLFIFMLLGFTLPLTGMAGIEMPMEPCPMQSMGMTEMAGMNQDCCQDAGKMTEHGKKSCKAGEECKTSSLLQVSVLKTPSSTIAPTVPAHYSDLILSQAPSERWRPPCA